MRHLRNFLQKGSDWKQYTIEVPKRELNSKWTWC